jgi:hypothetical protein
VEPGGVCVQRRWSVATEKMDSEMRARHESSYSTLE